MSRGYVIPSYILLSAKCINAQCHNLFFFQASIAKKFFPLLDRVLIQRSEQITKTASGLVIPEKAQSKVLHGTVVAVGPGARNQVIIF